MIGTMTEDGADSTKQADFPIRVVGLVKNFERLKVLKGITLQFPRGKTSVVLGPSGCGKSVLLKHLVGLERPDRGEVWYEGQRVDMLGEERLAPIRRQFGVLFQNGALFDSMSVEDNVAFPMLELEHKTPATAYERAERITRVLRMVGLEDTAHKMPSELSGGQRKRIALARAIVLRPKVILYDEPTTGLDPIRSDVINELIIKMKSALAATSIVVTHDLVSAFKVADFLVMMHEGEIILEGTPDQFRESKDPVVSRFLRGEASEAELREIREASRHDGQRSQPRRDSARVPPHRPH